MRFEGRCKKVWKVYMLGKGVTRCGKKIESFGKVLKGAEMCGMVAKGVERCGPAWKGVERI